MLKKTQASTYLSISAAVALAAALAGPVQAGPKKGGTLTVALETDVRGFDAVKGGVLGVSGETVMRTMTEPLLGMSRDWKPLPKLATEWVSSDDQKQITFKLRQGVKHHDGNDFTATDVAHHYNRILDPKNKARSRSFISAIKGATVVDANTVRFDLKHAWLPFMAFMATTSMSGPIPSHRAVAAGTQNRHPVGTGPFVFEKWAGGDRITVSRNPNYWNKDTIHLDKVVFRILPDTQTRYASLKSGEVDVIWTDRGNTIRRAEKDKDLAVHKAEGAGALITFFNTRKGPLSDQRVRAALSHAWSQNAIIKVTWKDTVPFVKHPYTGQFDCGGTNYRDYDPAKAKALLAEYGKPVKISMIHTTTPRGRELGEVLQQLYKKVGVELVLKPVDQNTLVKKVFTKDYEISGWRIADGADIGPQIFALHFSKSSYNLTGYSSPDLDKLALGMRTATEMKVRQNRLCRMAEIMNESGHIQYRGGRRYHAFAQKYVKDVPYLRRGVFDATTVWLDK
ncbi:MAG: ABC transporter substrate-binding protein [Alphaproteobacteria bacterium]|nr:ABC transporter substrate-binding protein [Alphaproteobacteria bacterium]MDP6829770.1 ABC transporter substrate-binding protein [Alphaproteobacteria bacterium]